MSFVSLGITTGTGIALAGGAGALGDVGSALIGSNAAGSAAQQAVSGQNAALTNILGGQQSAVSAMSPYYQGGLQDYDLLSYLMTGNANPGGVQALSPEQQAQEASDLSYIQNYGLTRGGQSGKYGAALADVESQYNQLQQQQEAYQAEQAAARTAQSSGLPANYLSTPFNLATAMQSGNGNQTLNLAMQQIASQGAAGGNVNSGNMDTGIANYIGGTFEPSLESQYTGQQQQLYNMLTGNTGGAGQQAAGSLANIYTGSANNAGNYLSGIGNALASGTLGQANAYSNALTGLGNQANSLLGMGLNYQNSQNTQGLLSQILANQQGLGSGSGANLLSNPYITNPYGVDVGQGINFNFTGNP